MARYGLWTPILQYASGVPKWAVGRAGRRISAVVIHRMDGTLESSDSWLKSRYSGSASTHFGVGLWGNTPQIRQWVDTSNTAWGWAARPNDNPTPVARRTLGPSLWIGSHDLNWQVIAVEVEGWSYQNWDPRTRAKVIELLRWIYRAHGNLTVMAHTDISSKPCPGMVTFQRALPGWYGNKLANIFGSTPAPTPTPAPRPPTAPTQDQIDMAILKDIVRNSTKVARVRGGASLYKGPGVRYGYWDPKVKGSLGVEVIGGIQGDTMRGSKQYWVARVGKANAKGLFFVHSTDVIFG